MWGRYGWICWSLPANCSCDESPDMWVSKPPEEAKPQPSSCFSSTEWKRDELFPSSPAPNWRLMRETSIVIVLSYHTWGWFPVQQEIFHTDWGAWRQDAAIIQLPGTSLAVQWLRLHLIMQGVQVLLLVGELRSHIPLSQKHKQQKQYSNKFNEDFKNGPYFLKRP